MTIFKCKMCEGSLEITNETVAVCEYCRTVQTIPRLIDDKRVILYDRANHFRRNSEYDKALSIYEQILLEDQTDAEAYWSILLCQYGIEYVEDPTTHKRIPTVNRVQLTSILDEENYKAALKYADSKQKKIYELEAKEINRIQKEILAISEKEEPYDVFICYKESDSNGQRTTDSVLAQDIYTQLEQEGMRVFFSKISLEDKLGSAYEPYIFAALNSAKVMIVVGSKPEHFNAVWVKNEWSRYLTHVKNGENKTIIPAYIDMSPYDLPVEFSHLQSQDMSKIGFMQDLVRGVKKLLSEDKSVDSRKTELEELKQKIQKQSKKNKLTIILAILIPLIIVAGVWAPSLKNTIQEWLSYKEGCNLIKEGRYHEAMEIFNEIDCFDRADKVKETLYYWQKERMQHFVVGNSVKFGFYEQDNDLDTNLEEIIWNIVEVKEGKALLVSDNILDVQPMHSEFTQISWKDCDLRKWLNEEFYNNAFGELHQNDIIATDIYFPTDVEGKDNIECVDKVFILDESKQDTGIDMTTYASKKGCGGRVWTITRTEGTYESKKYMYGCNYEIYEKGWPVNLELGVRPAIWITIE